MNKLKNLVSMAIAGGTEGAPQAYKANSSSDMMRLGDFIAMYSEDTFGFVYSKRYSATNKTALKYHHWGQIHGFTLSRALSEDFEPAPALLLFSFKGKTCTSTMLSLQLVPFRVGGVLKAGQGETEHS